MALLSQLYYKERSPAVLPVPMLRLEGSTTVSYIETVTDVPGASIQYTQSPTPIIVQSPPLLRVADIPNSLFTHYNIHLEPVIFGRKKSGNSVSKRNGMRVPGDYDQIGGRTSTVSITANDRYISLAPMLNNRFRKRDVLYRTATNQISSVACIVPFRTRLNSGSAPFLRFPYSSTYAPLYMAFRYRAYNTSNLSEPIVGPLSPTIKVAATYFPFRTNHYASSIYQVPCADYNGSFEFFTCTFAS